MYKELQNSTANNNNSYYPNKKWTISFSQCFSEEDIQMSNRYVETMFNMVTSNQSKYLLLLRMASINKD